MFLAHNFRILRVKKVILRMVFDAKEDGIECAYSVLYLAFLEDEFGGKLFDAVSNVNLDIQSGLLHAGVILIVISVLKRMYGKDNLFELFETDWRK